MIYKDDQRIFQQKIHMPGKERYGFLDVQKPKEFITIKLAL